MKGIVYVKRDLLRLNKRIKFMFVRLVRFSVGVVKVVKRIVGSVDRRLIGGRLLIVLVWRGIMLMKSFSAKDALVCAKNARFRLLYVLSVLIRMKI